MEISKKCTCCGIEKSLNMFGSQNRGLYGKRARCFECVKKYNAIYHQNRYSQDVGYRINRIKQAIKWVSENPEKRAKVARARNQKARQNNPEKIKARALVNQRVRFGRMPKATSLACVECGEQAAHYHHYNGYSFENRYDVQPVCIKCHKHLG